MEYHYQYNTDGSVSARIKSKIAPDHSNQITASERYEMKHLGYDKATKKFFEIKLDVDGKRIKKAGKYEKAKILN